MTHDIETSADGAASFVTAREHAWHRLGTVLPDTFDAAAAMTHAKLGGWNVRKEPVHAVCLGEEGVETVEVPGAYATVRTHPDTGRPDPLGVVGEQYRPIQNEQHCDLLDALVDESGAHFETAGSLKGGRQVFVSMKLPNTIEIGGVDPVATYLAALNSHDGSSAFRLLVTPVRIVCANTQAAAIRGAKASFSIHHTSGARGQIQAAREALGMTFKHMEVFQAEADAMIGEAMTEAQFVELIEQVWPVLPGATDRVKTNSAKRRLQLVSLYLDSPTATQIRGTRWAAYQAITEHLDHYAPVRTTGDQATARAERVVSGVVTEAKTRAFDLLRV